MKNYKEIRFPVNFEIAKKDIIQIFNNANQKIFRYSDLSIILDENREFLRINKNTYTDEFIAFLVTKIKKFKVHEFDFPFRKEIRYTWGEVPLFEILLTLNKNSYFSHYSAMYFNELTEQIPKSYYINAEQKKIKKQKPELTQAGIDTAFANKPRITTNTISIRDFKISILNGKYSSNLGVVERFLQDGTKIKVTNNERTLIDIAVRPFYSGGIFEVLNVYKKAIDNVSINKINAYLKELDYIYPYHQVIGFLLEKAGVYKDIQIDLLRKHKFEFDFYLTNQIENPEYSKKWRLYYPKGY